MPDPALPSPALLRVLAEPVRRAIVERLALEPRVLAGEIADHVWDHFHLAQPATSKHLRRLLDARVVEDDVQGGARYYSLRRAPFDALARWAHDLATPLPPDAAPFSVWRLPPFRA